MYFVRNLEITHVVGCGGEGKGESHAVCVIMTHSVQKSIQKPLYLNIFETIEKMELDNYD